MIAVAPSQKEPQAYARFVCLVAALAGLLFGLDIGVISGALPLISSQYQLSEILQEWVVSSLLAGAALGALITVPLLRNLGRRWVLIISGIFFVFGATGSAVADGFASLIAARVILGVAVGMGSFAGPLYLSEIAPSPIRGAMIATYQLMITVGILTAFLSNAGLSYVADWRWMLGLTAVPAALFLVAVIQLPESPRWLILRDRHTEALYVLRRLYGNKHDIEHEFQQIARGPIVCASGWTLLRNSPHFRRAVALGIVLQLFQQFTGINVVMYYAPHIFDLTGYSTQASQLWATVLVGVMNVIATVISIMLIDRCGRRPVLHFGVGVMAFAMTALGILMHLGMGAGVVASIATITVVLLFVGGFAMSAGPLVWVLCAEIQPSQGREFGIAASTFVNWIANLMVASTFLSVLTMIGETLTFLLFAGINVIFGAFVYFYVPETNGVTLEQLEHNLMRGGRLRDLGKHNSSIPG
ncbi:MFS transporter [Burkholderia sp. Nafp2/4-1b]|uniref:sugar porter family MFS transporter n=1 Tax=Burkholderia sp. Nafp2/4-1b TaxID=2116686 RepID=UPI000EF8F2BD|nr:sugar porter family MFS transporter [Burkholderia sp. Nafp2/4-1b]RKT98972.1 MFS transporter [Burkholderia sp. Nafp2/4-1b]